MNVGGKISVARHISREMTLISREREMCSGNSERGREDRDEGKRGNARKRDRRLSNRISKAQLMYTISRGRIIPGKKRGAEREGRFPATEIDHITLRLIKFKRC